MSPTTVPALSAAPKQMNELDETFAVRLGVFRPRVALSREQVVDEIDSVKMTSKVEYVFLEAATGNGNDSPNVNDTDFEWARVYFSSTEVAGLCAALLSYPGRRSKWYRFVTQRLPILTPITHPPTAAEALVGKLHVPESPDTMLLHTADGFSVVSTCEVFDTAAVRDWTRQKQTNTITSRDVCAKFYPDATTNRCTAGAACHCVHLREKAFLKLLLHPLPLSTNAGTVQGGRATVPIPDRCLWEQSRGQDTLFLPDLPRNVDAATMHYMFSQCSGFIVSDTVLTSSYKRHGVVVFDTPENATKAKEQASAAELVVLYYSESCMHHKEGVETEDPVPPHTKGIACGSNKEKSVSGGAVDQEERAAAESEDAPPFPPLPEGWEYGLSRRTMQYFFLQTGKKSTTFKHPVTQDRYSAKR